MPPLPRYLTVRPTAHDYASRVVRIQTPPRAPRPTPPTAPTEAVVADHHIHRYSARDQATYRFLAQHIERCRLTAVVEMPDRREVWLAGLWLGRQPKSAPPGLPLAGKLALPILRRLLRLGLFGPHASAALYRLVFGEG